jgi:adenylyl-sulfate kinase
LAYVLDGDNFRRGLASDLGFSPADRDENIRRAGEVAALLADAGLIAVAAFISPYRAGRGRARQAAPQGRFVEVFVDTPIEVCQGRDPKGLYGKARAGALSDFTGVDAPYEPPEAPELVLTTDGTPEDCAAAIEQHLRDRGLLLPPASE